MNTFCVENSNNKKSIQRKSQSHIPAIGRITQSCVFEQQHLNATTSVMCILWISASGKYLIFPFTQHPEILWLNRIHWNNEEAFTAPLIPRTCRSEAQARFDRGRRIAVYSIDLPSEKPCTFRVKPNRL